MFGLRLFGGEYFKIKYLHVGFLCTISIALVAGLSFSWFYQREVRGVVSDHRQYLRKRNVVLTMLLVGGLYLQLVLAPPGSMPAAAQVSLLTVVIIWLVNASWPSLFKRKTCLVGSLIGLAVIFAASECAMLVGPVCLRYTLPTSTARTLLGTSLTIALSLLLGRLIYLWSKESRDGRPFCGRVLHFALTVPLGLFVYYNVIIGFARFIYPYIPVSKGGGDYSDVHAAVLYLSRDADRLPAALHMISKDASQSDPVVILEETSDYLYVARDVDNERRLWGKDGSRSAPEVYQVSKHEIMDVERAGH
jgi:hypothetical protein